MSVCILRIHTVYGPVGAMGDVKYPAGSDGTEPLEKEPGPGAARLVLLVLLYGVCQEVLSAGWLR